jgi:hypothetical protein
MFNKPFFVIGLMNKSSSLAPALGATESVAVIELYHVSLCCAT